MPTLPIQTVVLPTVLVGQPNGRLPSSILVATPGLAGGPVVLLVAPAARAWRAMTAAAGAAGHVLKATSLYDSYRPYEVQERIFRARYTTEILPGRPKKWWDPPGPEVGKYWYQRPNTAAAAVPATSNHGLGLAVDIGEESDGDAGTESIDAIAVQWLIDNAWRYGYSAELQSEPWHWRYYRGDNIPAAVLAYEEDPMPVLDDIDVGKVKTAILGDGGIQQLVARVEALVGGRDPIPGANNQTNTLHRALSGLLAAAAEDKTRDAAVLAAVQALANAGGVDAAPIVAAVREEAAATRQQVTDLQARVAELEEQLAAYRQAEAAAAQAAAEKLAG